MGEVAMAGAEKQATFRVPLYVRLVRFTLRPIFRLLFRLLCRIEIEGRENIPQEGAYIIAHNHISLFEPPFIIAFWPKAPEGISGADVFERPFFKFFVKAYGAIPVHRGEYDRQVIENTLTVLRAGKALMIAPEGGRSHAPGLRQARAGVAYLMDRAQVPVLPVGIIGSTDDMFSRAIRFKRPQLMMRIGKPFNLPPIQGKGEARRAARQANADLVMRHIAVLLPEDYRGVYQLL